MIDIVPILVVIVLVVINGLFVAAEFALIGSPRTQIEQAAQDGHPMAKVVLGILKDPVKQDHYIATAQLGITLASLGLGMYGERKLADYLFQHFQPYLNTTLSHTFASLIAIGFLTFLHIVLGEMVPKSMALQKAQKTAMWITPFVILVQKALYPVILLLNGLGNWVLTLFGIRRDKVKEGLSHTPEELEFVFKESQEGGQLRKKTREILQDLLYFGHLSAGEAMVPRVKIIGIPVRASADEVRTIITQSRHTRYPLYDGNLDNIVGIVHSKDFLRAQLKGTSRPVAEMLRPVPYVPEAASLEQVLRTMRKHNAHMVIVIDEFGGTAGLLAIEDLFEEVVGEIGEGVGETPEILKDKLTGIYRVLGGVRLEDLGVRLHLNLEHEDVDTVGGLIMTLLGRLPKVGDTVEYLGYQYEVLEVDGHGTKVCSVKPLSSPEQT